MEPVCKVTYALKDSLDRAIDRYEENLKGKIKLKEKDQAAWTRFVNNERNKVRIVADLQSKLKVYRSQSASKSEEELEDEPHDSRHLGEHMRADGIAKPGPFWDAHAMISGAHEEAWILRVLLAECKIGIDDSINGCWLPRNSKYAGRKPYPKAVPHSRIHRYNYYIWMNIRFANIGGDADEMINRLRLTRSDLLHGSFPPEVMLKKGQWKIPYDNI